jgi:DNA-binding LytR/AlgR family response regulator
MDWHRWAGSNYIFETIKKHNLELHITMQSLQNIPNGAYMQAAESYCIMVLQNGKTDVKSRPMKFFEQKLTDIGWFRIHRSYMVNPACIEAISEDKDFVFLQNGKVLPIARRKKKPVYQWIISKR